MLGLSMHNSHSLRALLILDIQGFSPSLAAVQMGGSTQAETGTSWGGERVGVELCPLTALRPLMPHLQQLPAPPMLGGKGSVLINIAGPSA